MRRERRACPAEREGARAHARIAPSASLDHLEGDDVSLQAVGILAQQRPISLAAARHIARHCTVVGAAQRGPGDVPGGEFEFGGLGRDEQGQEKEKDAHLHRLQEECGFRL